ncbi:hypothetical protein LPJ72_004712 [Coemansia sp. Benny D160-2]|nr:hypothetical protein LPJ72_004712 [Coemansia sp. Benny D160-2]
MVLLLNQQRAVWVPLRTMRRQIERLVACSGYAGWDVGVHLVTDQRIRELNGRYRGQDKATDILSFPFHAAQTPETEMLLKASGDRDDEDGRSLGDMFLAMPYILARCREDNDRLAAHLPVLVAHGICHLLGYDHEADEDYEAMRRREFQILSRYYSRARG